MIVILLISVGLFYVIQNKVYQKHWDKSLTVELSFTQDAVYEGEVASIHEIITNAKKLPIPVLEVAFELHSNMSYMNPENTVVTDQCYKRDFYVMSSWQKITRNLEFYCQRRGYYQIKNVDLMSRSIMMDSKFLKKENQDTALYVYPRMISTDQIEIPFQKIMGTISTRRYIYEDPFEFQGIRSYELSDPMSKINWKASAKSDHYMVNVFGSTTMQSVCILLDIEDSTILKHEPLIEESIRIANSLAVKLSCKGVPVQLISNGKDQLTKKVIGVPKGSGLGQNGTINRSMARMDISQDSEGMISCIRGIDLESGRDDTIYVMISKNQKPELIQEYNSLVMGYPGSMWIAPLEFDMELKLNKRDGYDVIRWEIEH